MELFMPEVQLVYPRPVTTGNLQNRPLGLSSSAAANITPVAPQDVYLGVRRNVLLGGGRVTITQATIAPERHGSSQIFFLVGAGCSLGRTVELRWETRLVRAAEVRITCNPPKVESVVDAWLASAKRRIIEFEKLHEGWDDEDALAFSPDTIRNARTVLKTMSAFLEASGTRTFPALVPLPDGSIRFEWVNGDRELFLTILHGNIEAQKWQPLGSVQSLSYAQMHPEALPAELEWLAS
jgi:hypothetical protein